MARYLVPANPRSRADIELKTTKIIQKYQPNVFIRNEPFDIERFFDLFLEDLTGVTTDYRKLPNGVYGYTDTDKMECVISSDLAEDPLQEKFYRSTMAHEVGHALFHVDDYRQKKAIMHFIHEKNHLIRAYRQEEIITYKNPEWQAWRFAGAILMPEPLVKAAIRDGLNENKLSDLFNVNPAFVRTRLKALSL